MLINIDKNIEKFNALALRLRIIITLAVIAITFILIDLFWFSENDKIIAQTNNKIITAKKQSEELLNIQKQQNQNILKKRNNPETIKLNSLKKELSKIQNQLVNKTINLVQPEEMANVLKTIIMSTSTLELILLSKQETVELSDKKTDKPNNEKEQNNQVKLYRHSMEIILQGDYSSTYEFLKKLEEMQKKVTFDSFEYAVSQYPQAEIKLNVSTLSLQKGWIGG